MSEVEALFERIWGPGGVTVPLLRSLVLSGNYVAGAWAHDQLMGASISFLSPASHPRSAHLHISGVAPSAQGSGIGYALLCHQRTWALERGIEQITWTFDPLVRRNGWFATVKLGARCDSYLPDWFGYLNDPINRWDYTDRCLARWDLAGATPGSNSPADVEDPHIGTRARSSARGAAANRISRHPTGSTWTPNPSCCCARFRRMRTACVSRSRNSHANGWLLCAAPSLGPSTRATWSRR